MLSRRFCLSLAGYVLCVESSDVAMAASGAVEKFVCSPSTPPDLTIDLVIDAPSVPAGAQQVFDSGGLWTLHENPEGGRIIALSSEAFAVSPYATLSLSDDLRRGHLVIDSSAVRNGTIYPLDYPLDEVLLGMLLANSGGIEFHCAGIIDERGDGHLFIAQSETGKTTTANLWLEHAPGCRILSDDRVVVRMMDDVEVPVMFGTPWHGDAMLSDVGSAPLRSLILLRQSKTNEYRDLPSSEATARLLTCIFPPFYDHQLLESSMTELVRLIDRTERVAEFGFVPDVSAVEFIRAQLDLR